MLNQPEEMEETVEMAATVGTQVMAPAVEMEAVAATVGMEAMAAMRLS